MATVNNVIKDLNKINFQKHIKIRIKPLKSGGYSVYLDIWHNSKRQYLFIGLRLQDTTSSRDKDQELIKLAVAIRDKKEIELVDKAAGFEFNKTDSCSFIDYFDKTMKQRIKSGLRLSDNWASVRQQVINFSSEDLAFNDIDVKFCRAFVDFLSSKYKPATTKTMYMITTSVINSAIKDKIISTNPFKGITVSVPESDRQFLTLEELKQIIITPCRFPQISDAFLFSCFTGLRYSDIIALTFDQIKDGYISFKQVKTGGVERIKLSENALEIIERRRANNHGKNVFIAPHCDWNNIIIREWIKAAGITKHISFHSGPRFLDSSKGGKIRRQAG